MKKAVNILDARRLSSLRRNLLAWYRANRRDLPWRGGRDAYRIWIAEIMLQQTRIAAVLPYYERFLARFPDVATLARAREADVLKYWAGLGYYSRARNLHRAAKIIVRQHAAQFPAEHEQALALPGIGSYTAAAILSIAYDVPLGAVDGNIARVLARLFAIRGDLRAQRNWKRLGEIAQRLLPANAAGDWNQALMELGETICTPRTPNCAACPIAQQCKARALGLTRGIPAPRKKRAAENICVAAVVFVDARGRTLVTKTPGAHDSVLFSRLWQFPAVAITSRNGKAADELGVHLQAKFALPQRALLIPLTPAAHTVTYRKLALLPFLAQVNHLPASLNGNFRSVALARLATLPVSNATRKIAQAALRAIAAQIEH